MPWVKLDDDFYDHPKVVALSDAGFRLWARMLGWTNRYLTGGDIPTARLSDKERRLAVEIERVGLWDPIESGWHIHDYEQFQPAPETTKTRRSDLAAKRAEAGRKGAQNRWQTDSNDHGKPMANAMANGWQADSPVPVPVPPVITFSPPPTFVGDRSARVEEALSLITARERVRAGSTIRNLDGWTHTVIERNRYDHGSTLHRLAHEHPDWAVEQLADSIAPTAFAERPSERPICAQCNRHTLGLYECPPNRPDCPTAFRCPGEPA
jgi:hypothetical protein